VLVAGIGAMLMLAACGGSEQHGAASGRKVFAQAGCGDCHTLAEAKAKGTVGPNLDDAKPDAALVVRQVTNGGGGMPSFRGKLQENEIQAVASFVAAATRTATGGRSAAAAFEPDRTRLRNCKPSDFPCYEQAFANIAYRRGPKAALDAFDARIRAPGPIEADCHRIAHAIGAGALAHFDGNVGKALVQGRASCAAGYYHGILERSFLGVPRSKVGGVARRICADPEVKRLEFIRYQCVHGLGHGLMIYSGYDLPLSLKICTGLNGGWEQRSCAGGVFMENLQSSYGVRSPWLKDSDPIYPCDAVRTRWKGPCYLIETARILPLVGYDWKRAAAACRRSERGWVALCFQSLGRDASGFTRLDVPRVLRICAEGRDMARECVYGAARDMVYTDAGARRAKVLCNAAPAAMRSYCWTGIGTMVGTLHARAAATAAACRRATARYYRACLRGAEAR
jgi:cytochrome c553